MKTDQQLAAQADGILRDVFGFHSFLPDQKEIVEAILARQDAFVVMPTGGGKSLCYQLPALVMDGTCIVISPLISLMKDQVDAAITTGLRASFLNSSLSASMKRQVEAALAAGELDLIYVSPERFAMPEFIATLKRVKLAFVAIDEAHCISEWGHDFRPDYLNLSTIVREFPAVPVTAFTATATHKVQDDIVAKLGLRSPHVVRASFNRPNLFYKVIPKENPGEQILSFVRAHAGEPGIVYRTTRKSVEQTAAMLTRNGISALPYHAGLDDATRVRNQDAFNKDEVNVIVATIAFGMGIDKSNVRYVLHGDLPKNIESYYQETGRSGRDGEPAHCLLLFGYGDVPKIRFFIDPSSSRSAYGDRDNAAPSPTGEAAEEQRRHAIKQLNDMVHYATVHACRRKQLLNYFGETWPPEERNHESTRMDTNGESNKKAISPFAAGQQTCCPADEGPHDNANSFAPAQNPSPAAAPNNRGRAAGNIRVNSRSSAVPSSSASSAPQRETALPCCDICEGEVESMDATIDAQIVMSAIARTGQRFGINHIVSVVTGDASDRIRQLGHDRIKTFGVGREVEHAHFTAGGDVKQHWRIMIDNLLAQGFIEQTPGDYPVLKLQPESREVLFGSREVHVLKTRKLAGKRRKVPASAAAGPYNEELFDLLRNLRKQLATEQGVPPYVIFTDRTLHEMARPKPARPNGSAYGGGQVGQTGGPATVADLLEITGVGQAKLERYGRQFFESIRAFWEDHPDAED
jgi:RecQ family ATP-dependent DNA helicase